MNNDSKGKLLRVIDSTAEIRHKWVLAFESAGENDRDQIYRKGPGILWYDHERLALKSFFIDQKPRDSKQHFYTCGKIDEFLIKKYDANIFEYGINHFSYAVLSDSPDLIQRYSSLSYCDYEKNIQGGTATPLYILQCLVKDDFKEFERAMIYMKTKTIPKFKAELDAIYYEALANRDKSKIESVLSEFVTPKMHKQRNKYFGLVNEFISHPAIGYAKLAWMKGIEVEVSSELIPRELLPVKPLEHYKLEYEFLKELNEYSGE